jgi:hypothetical protein
VLGDDVLERRSRLLAESVEPPPKREPGLDVVPRALIDYVGAYVEARLAEALANQRSVIVQGIAEAVAEHVAEVERRLERRINKRLGELKTEVAQLSARHDGDVVDLPALDLRRRA